MVENRMRHFQEWLCYQLEAADGSGGSRRQVFKHGEVLEKSSGAFSAVWGTMSQQAARALPMPNPAYFATGVLGWCSPRAAPACPFRT